VYLTPEGTTGVSIYRVHFKWKGKDVELCAKSLDLTHPYFVSIKDLIFPAVSSLIINPSDDDLKRAFGDANHLMIPFQMVSLVEELPETEHARVMPFSLVERSPEAEATDSVEAASSDATTAGVSGSVGEAGDESEAERW
jgi:hypothetical protein